MNHNVDYTIECFKTKLVAKEYTQSYEIDYTKTFAHITKMNTIRVLLSLAAKFDWSLQQYGNPKKST